MAVNYGVPFGPNGRPGHMVNSVFFFDDFIGTSLSATDDAAVWDDLTESGGTAVIAVDEPNGVVTLTPNDTLLDASIELNGEPFQFLRGADMLFECRWKVSSIATNTMDLFIGLAETALDMESGSVGAIDVNAVGFYVQGDANIDSVTSDGTATEVITDTTDDLVAATYVVTTWKYQASSETIRFYVDGNLRTSHTTGIPADATNMTLTMRAQGHSGYATASLVDLDVDYVLFAQDRI